MPLGIVWENDGERTWGRMAPRQVVTPNLAWGWGLIGFSEEIDPNERITYQTYTMHDFRFARDEATMTTTVYHRRYGVLVILSDLLLMQQTEAELIVGLNELVEKLDEGARTSEGRAQQT